MITEHNLLSCASRLSHTYIVERLYTIYRAALRFEAVDLGASAAVLRMRHSQYFMCLCRTHVDHPACTLGNAGYSLVECRASSGGGGGAGRRIKLKLQGYYSL